MLKLPQCHGKLLNLSRAISFIYSHGLLLVKCPYVMNTIKSIYVKEDVSSFRIPRQVIVLLA